MQNFGCYTLEQGLFRQAGPNSAREPKPKRTFSANDDWQSYKAQFGKAYEDPDTDVQRMAAFLNSRDLVERHNRAYAKGKVTYEMGINHLSDKVTS